jgi:hypothetical protein
MWDLFHCAVSRMGTVQDLRRYLTVSPPLLKVGLLAMRACDSVFSSFPLFLFSPPSPSASSPRRLLARSLNPTLPYLTRPYLALPNPTFTLAAALRRFIITAVFPFWSLSFIFHTNLDSSVRYSQSTIHHPPFVYFVSHHLLSLFLPLLSLFSPSSLFLPLCS